MKLRQNRRVRAARGAPGGAAARDVGRGWYLGPPQLTASKAAAAALRWGCGPARAQLAARRRHARAAALARRRSTYGRRPGRAGWASGRGGAGGEREHGRRGPSVNAKRRTRRPRGAAAHRRRRCTGHTSRRWAGLGAARRPPSAHNLGPAEGTASRRGGTTSRAWRPLPLRRGRPSTRRGGRARRLKGAGESRPRGAKPRCAGRRPRASQDLRRRPRRGRAGERPSFGSRGRARRCGLPGAPVCADRLP